MNNYLMNNNLTRDERLFLDGDDEIRMGRGRISGNPQEDNIIPQMFSKIKDDLDEISNF